MAIYASICLYFYVSSSPFDLVSTVITRPLCNCLVKKINQGTDVFTHKITELPASSFSIICVLKHVRTRLIMLTCGKNNHKIKIAGTGQLAIGIRPLDCKYIVCSKWSCAFLDLRSSDCTCARKSTCFVSRII